MSEYLDAVLTQKLPINHEIIASMQDMLNLLPNLNVASLSKSLTGATRTPCSHPPRPLPTHPPTHASPSRPCFQCKATT